MNMKFVINAVENKTFSIATKTLRKKFFGSLYHVVDWLRFKVEYLLQTVKLPYLKLNFLYKWSPYRTKIFSVDKLDLMVRRGTKTCKPFFINPQLKEESSDILQNIHTQKVFVSFCIPLAHPFELIYIKLKIRNFSFRKCFM